MIVFFSVLSDPWRHKKFFIAVFRRPTVSMMALVDMHSRFEAKICPFSNSWRSFPFGMLEVLFFISETVNIAIVCFFKGTTGFQDNLPCRAVSVLCFIALHILLPCKVELLVGTSEENYRFVFQFYPINLEGNLQLLRCKQWGKKSVH